MTPCKNLSAILNELNTDAQAVSEDEVQQVVKEIMQANRVFVAGAGRSGFAARAFSNRLLHLGYRVAFVGEPTTPPIKQGDLLIICSGSGETASLVAAGKKATAQGARVALLTIFPQSTIGKLAVCHIAIPGITSKTTDRNIKKSSIQPRGSSFEQLTWLICDSMVMYLKEYTHQSNDDLYARHANME